LNEQELEVPMKELAEFVQDASNPVSQTIVKAFVNFKIFWASQNKPDVLLLGDEHLDLDEE
jgi:hypothetical protein